MPAPALTLHVLPPSHPCMTAEAALRRKGLEYERVALQAGQHVEEMQAIYGEGRTTVPGLLVGDEPVHGSVAILERLEELAPEPSLYPEPIADAVREAERWADAELQDLGRSLTWGAMHFRPEAMGTFGGGEPLDPAGTDFAIKVLRPTWKYHDLSAVKIAEHLAGLPAKLDRVDALADEDRQPLNDLRSALDAGELGAEGFQTALRLGGGSAAELKRILFRPPPAED